MNVPEGERVRPAGEVPPQTSRLPSDLLLTRAGLASAQPSHFACGHALHKDCFAIYACSQGWSCPICKLEQPQPTPLGVNLDRGGEEEEGEEAEGEGGEEGEEGEEGDIARGRTKRVAGQKANEANLDPNFDKCLNHL